MSYHFPRVPVTFMFACFSLLIVFFAYLLHGSDFHKPALKLLAKRRASASRRYPAISASDVAYGTSGGLGNNAHGGDGIGDRNILSPSSSVDNFHRATLAYESPYFVGGGGGYGDSNSIGKKSPGTGRKASARNQIPPWNKDYFDEAFDDEIVDTDWSDEVTHDALTDDEFAYNVGSAHQGRYTISALYRALERVQVKHIYWTLWCVANLTWLAVVLTISSLACMRITTVIDGIFAISDMMNLVIICTIGLLIVLLGIFGTRLAMKMKRDGMSSFSSMSLQGSGLMSPKGIIFVIILNALIFITRVVFNILPFIPGLLPPNFLSIVNLRTTWYGILLLCACFLTWEAVPISSILLFFIYRHSPSTRHIPIAIPATTDRSASGQRPVATPTSTKRPFSSIFVNHRRYDSDGDRDTFDTDLSDQDSALSTSIGNEFGPPRN